MSEEDAFLDGIAADRADRTRLLVFADWLADRDDPREEFVRVHAQLLDMDGTETEFEELDKEWRTWAHNLWHPRSTGTPRRQLPNRWLDTFCRISLRSVVEEYLTDTREQEPPFVQRREFGVIHHRDPDEGCSLTLYHAKAARCATPFAFIAGTVRADLRDDPFYRFQTTGVLDCSPITRGAFWGIWRYHCGKLIRPPQLPEIAADNSFLGAEHYNGGFGNWARVAIHQHDYFALFWSTTA